MFVLNKVKQLEGANNESFKLKKEQYLRRRKRSKKAFANKDEDEIMYF